MFGFLDKLAINKGLMLLLCSISLALLLVELCFAVKRGKLHARGVITTTCKAVVIVAVSFLAGFLLSRLPMNGAWASVVYYAAVVLVAAAVLVIYIVGERRAVRVATANALRKSAGNTASVRYAKGWMYASAIALLISAAVMLAIGKQNYYMAVVPVALIAVALLLHAFLQWRLWYALSALALMAFFIYILYVDIISPNLLSLMTDVPAVASAVMLTASVVTLALRKE